MQFPALTQAGLVYLDNAATTQKPQTVLDAMNAFYQHDNANVHRAAHRLSARATRAYEGARRQLASFINAPQEETLIFTSGTTDGMNLLASSLGDLRLQATDWVLVDQWAHHASIVPWQQACLRHQCQLAPIPMTTAGQLDFDAYQQLLQRRPKIVVLTAVSNALGCRIDLPRFIAAAKAVEATVIIDGAQLMAHQVVDVQALDCDFLVFSGHKMYGPTGIGVLWGKAQWLNAMAPYRFGGEMITQVSFQHSTFNQLPFKFEAGTPAIAEAIGLGAAAQWLTEQNRVALAAHEQTLLQYAQQQLRAINAVTLYSAFDDNIGSVAFNLDGEHHQDVASWLDQAGVAIRSGHHCCQPLMQHLAIKGCCRLSIAPYNRRADIDAAIAAIQDYLDFITDAH